MRSVTALFVMLCGLLSQAAFAQTPGQCYERKQLVQFDELLGEINLSEVTGQSEATSVTLLLVGSRESRNVAGFSASASEPGCFRLAWKGFGWAGAKLSARSGLVAQGLPLSSTTKVTCKNYPVGLCGANEPMIQTEIAAGRKLVTMFMRNQHWDKKGVEQFLHPRIVMWFADRKTGAVRGLEMHPSEDWAVIDYQGTIKSSQPSRKGMTSAAIYQDWKNKRPTLPGESVLALGALGMQPQGCITPSQIGVIGSEVFSVRDNATQKSTMRMYAAPDGRWTILGMPSDPAMPCAVKLAEGDRFISADYVRDKYQQTSIIRNPYFDPVDVNALCVAKQNAYRQVANTKLTCNTLESFIEAAINSKSANGPYGQAFTARVLGDGEPVFLSGMASPTGAFQLMQTDSWGGTSVIYLGDSFEYTQQYRQMHFRDRWAGQDRERRDRAEQERLAKLENDRLARQLEIDRQRRARQALVDEYRAESPLRQIRLDLINLAIAQDSGSWSAITNYKPHSTHNLRIYPDPDYRFRGATLWQADYHFTRFGKEQEGWVVVRTYNNKVHCLTYHDFPMTCRPIDKSVSSSKMALGLIALAAVLSAEK